jgi:asparagine synthetase B (glutamine-hydrolysing)
MPARHTNLCTGVYVFLPPGPPVGSNSEIYNHQALREGELAGVDLHSRSDSAVVGYLYQKYGDTNQLWNSLDGIFACVIWDERTGYFCAARDPIGICSLYWGRGADGSVWFASEMKALQSKCTTIDCFPPVSGVRAWRAGLWAARGTRLVYIALWWSGAGFLDMKCKGVCHVGFAGPCVPQQHWQA